MGGGVKDNFLARGWAGGSPMRGCDHRPAARASAGHGWPAPGLRRDMSSPTRTMGGGRRVEISGSWYYTSGDFR